MKPDRNGRHPSKPGRPIEPIETRPGRPTPGAPSSPGSGSGGGAPLPRGEASLDQRGIEKLANIASRDPAQAQAAADFLERDPKAAIAHLFRLSARQQEAIANTPDARLKERIAPAISALRANNLARPQFDQGVGPEPAVSIAKAPVDKDPGGFTPELECSCKIKF